MGFDVAAEAYDRFMGRYSRLLSPLLVDLAEVRPGHRVIDVGCGPGALIEVLVERLGADAIMAADPSPPFVEAARARFPGVRVEQAPAEALPFESDAVDVTLAQLVVHFMSDPVAGLTEMRRVTRPGGVVAASAWDFAGERSPLSLFWRAARDLDANVVDESHLAGTREGHLQELFEAAGLTEVHETALVITRDHATFDEWWEPYTGGVGPAGAYLATLPADRVDALRERCRALLPAAPFTITSAAWAARGIA
jgi:SAM-dependent methyltransferase